MRIVLAAPSRCDPAHRRVLSALKAELAALGESVTVFPPRRDPGQARLKALLEALLRRRRPHILHAHFFSRGLGYLSRVRLPARTRLILTHQGASLELLEDKAAFRRLARRAALLTAVSRGGLRRLRAFLAPPRRPAFWVPNGARPARPRGAAPAKPFILCVSRLAAYKGTDLLLMAFAGFSRRDDADLLICGPDQTGGRTRAFLARLGLEDRVQLLGDVGPERIQRLLSRALFFVLPSRQENLPMALLEAMAAGKAAIAADVGGVREVLRHGVCGLLVPPRDPAALEKAMLRLARDRRLRARLGRQAELDARAFSWARAAADYRRLYQRAQKG